MPVRYFVLSLFVLILAAQAISQAPKTRKEKISYALGVNTARNWGKESADIDLNMYIKGLKDALENKNVLMSDEESSDSVKAFNKDNFDHAMAEMKKLADKNKKEGAKFLEENRKKPGVVMLSDSLQYKVLKEGSGKRPTLEDTVTVNYKGTLLDGTEFDSSVKQGKPAVLPLGRLIKGWTEALQLMRPGAKWQIFVPPNLAYGEHGKQPAIGPNATLIFEIELLSFKEGTK